MALPSWRPPCSGEPLSASPAASCSCAALWLDPGADEDASFAASGMPVQAPMVLREATASCRGFCSSIEASCAGVPGCSAEDVPADCPMPSASPCPAASNGSITTARAIVWQRTSTHYNTLPTASNAVHSTLRMPSYCMPASQLSTPHTVWRLNPHLPHGSQIPLALRPNWHDALALLQFEWKMPWGQLAVW